MPSISKYASSIRGGFGKFAHAVRERWRVLTVTILFICIPVYAMAWWLNIHNNLAANIAATGVVTAMPVAELFAVPSSLRSNKHLLWMAAFALVALAVFISDEREWRIVSTNGAVILVSSLAYFAIWLWIRNNWFLMSGLILALVAMTIYWAAFWVQNSGPLELVTLPLLLISVGGVSWAPPAMLVLEIARLRKNGKISGPGWQAFAMATLFLPVIMVTITIPPMLGLGDIWSAASLTIVSIMLGSVISAPLRCLFVEWGNLSPNQNASASPNPYAD